MMKIKRRLTGTTAAPSSLGSGQLAWSVPSQTLYVGDGDDGSGNATSVKSIGGSGVLNTKVAKTGDTMSGSLSISCALPTLHLNKPDTTSSNQIVSYVDGIPRWNIELGDATAATNLKINYYDAAGNYVATPLWISRTDGSARFASPIFSPEPSQSSHAATKNYVDLASNTKLNTAGGTMTGQLTMSNVPIAWPNNSGIYADTGTGNIVVKTYDGSLHYTTFLPNGGIYSPGTIQSAGDMYCSTLHSSGNIAVAGSLFVGSATYRNDGDIYMPWLGDWISNSIVRVKNNGNYFYTNDGQPRLAYSYNDSSVYRGAGNWVHQFIDNGTGNTRWLMENSGKFYSNGEVVAYWSSAKLKENVESVDPVEGLQRVLAYRVVDFGWNDAGVKLLTDKKKGDRERGLIAEESQIVNPETVAKNVLGIDENGEPYLTLNGRSPFIWDLIGAVQSQQKTIDELRSRIAALEAKS